MDFGFPSENFDFFSFLVMFVVKGYSHSLYTIGKHIRFSTLGPCIMDTMNVIILYDHIFPTDGWRGFCCFGAYYCYDKDREYHHKTIYCPVISEQLYAINVYDHISTYTYQRSQPLSLAPGLTRDSRQLGLRNAGLIDEERIRATHHTYKFWFPAVDF